MKYLEPILVFALIASICVFVYVKEFPKDNIKTQTKEIVKLETKVKYVRDTVTRIELRLKKAKAIHDTVEIVKEQDTLIKFLTIENKLQDTLIKRQDTVIVDCEKITAKQKRRERFGFGVGFGLGFVSGVVATKLITR